MRGEPYLKRRWYQFSIKELECKEDDVGAHAAEDQLPAGKLIDHPGLAHTKFYSRNRLLKRVVIDQYTVYHLSVNNNNGEGRGAY